jgi:hypothetical protein
MIIFYGGLMVVTFIIVIPNGISQSLCGVGFVVLLVVGSGCKMLSLVTGILVALLIICN